MSRIIDISHHQDPAMINYDELANHVDLAIIRTQYGSKTVDRHYLTHHAEFRKRGVVTNSYAWVRGVSIADMEVEATDFYNRTRDLNPEVWWLDVEEQSMIDMRAGVSAYVKKLRSLGVKKIGIYIAHHLYSRFNLNYNEVDAVWIPHYGKNNGELNSKPQFPCDLHQFTSVGKLPGYDGNLDINILMGAKPLEWFTGKSTAAVQTPQVAPVTTNSKYVTVAGHATHYATGESIADYVKGKQYKVLQEKEWVKGNSQKAYLLEGIMSWVLEQDIVGYVAPAAPQPVYYVVRSGDNLTKIAKNNGTTVNLLVSLNGIKNPNKIYPGQNIRVK
ncbi:LysM peptidoglycan-binding domain-containing protein [Neobacillus niacini]|uniref:LysM peptidoglycan-binding domain-containing protein n=1 Tax=Neobacillus niacini TaxID=86668 RepID=UPI002FFDF729